MSNQFKYEINELDLSEKLKQINLKFTLEAWLKYKATLNNFDDFSIENHQKKSVFSISKYKYLMIFITCLFLFSIIFYFLKSNDQKEKTEKKIIPLPLIENKIKIPPISKINDSITNKPIKKIYQPFLKKINVFKGQKKDTQEIISNIQTDYPNDTKSKEIEFKDTLKKIER